MVLVCGRLCVERCERKRRIKGVSPPTLFSGEIPPLLFSLFACSSGFILSVLGRISPGSRRLYFGARRSRSTPWDGQAGRIEATSPPAFILSLPISGAFVPLVSCLSFVFLCLERSERMLWWSSSVSVFPSLRRLLRQLTVWRQQARSFPCGWRASVDIRNLFQLAARAQLSGFLQFVLSD